MYFFKINCVFNTYYFLEKKEFLKKLKYFVVRLGLSFRILKFWILWDRNTKVSMRKEKVG